MKTLRTALTLFIFAIAAKAANGQSVDEIVNKYILAMGGKDAIGGVKTIYEEGTLNAMGQESPSTTNIISGKGFKNVVDFNGQQFIQVLTDKSGWVINPMAGQTSPTPMPDAQFKTSRMQLDIGGPLYDYAAKGSKLELLGKDTTGGVNTYHLKLTSKDSIELHFFIDVKTSYLDRMTSKSDEGDITANFSDYKKVDGGLLVPFAEELILPQFTINMTTKKVEVNKPIDPAIFDMPK